MITIEEVNAVFQSTKLRQIVYLIDWELGRHYIYDRDLPDLEDDPLKLIMMICERIVKEGQKDILLNTIRKNRPIRFNRTEYIVDINRLKDLTDWDNWTEL